MSPGPLELLTVSAALQAGGTVIQKHRVATRLPGLSLARVTRRLGGVLGVLVRDPWWVVGGLLGLAGGLVGLQALAQMDLSMLKALSRIETLFIVGAGVVFLGERLRAHETAGVLLLVAGAVLLALSAGEATGRTASREAHLLLVAGVLGLLAAFAAASRRRGPRLRPELALAGAAGLLFGMADTLTKGATQLVKDTTGGFSVVQGSSLGGLVQTPEFGLALVGYVTGSVLVQTAFSTGRVSVIGPVLVIGSMLLPIGFALAVLQESLSPDRMLGIATVAAGTLMLARSARGPA